MKRRERWQFLSVRRVPDKGFYAMAWKPSRRRNQYMRDRALAPLVATDMYQSRRNAISNLFRGIPS